MMSEVSMDNNLNPGNCESQNVAIARYLEAGGRLTPTDALNLFGCFRLAARIGELRQKGMKIRRVDVNVLNKKGRKIHVGEYSLEASE